MVSRKRCSYMPVIEESSMSEDSSDYEEYVSRDKQTKFNLTTRNLNQSNTKLHLQDGRQKSLSEGNENNEAPKRRQKCHSRNALMARENRLKKKIYIEGLESQIKKLKQENKTLRSILNNQSHVITGLTKEVKYLKSVVANSSDLGNLLKTINANTGMSVTTSLDKTLTFKNTYVSKKNACNGKTAHPWEEKEEINETMCQDRSTPCSPSTSLLSDDLGITFDDPMFTDIHQFEKIESLASLSEFGRLHNNELCPVDALDQISPEITLREHNYTATPYSNQDVEDVGICLHVSNHKVSLEFCSTCSENASQAWLTVE